MMKIWKYILLLPPIRELQKKNGWEKTFSFRVIFRSTSENSWKEKLMNIDRRALKHTEKHSHTYTYTPSLLIQQLVKLSLRDQFYSFGYTRVIAVIVY